MATIPLAYPKMPGSKESPSGPCVAFEKYDGTNLHWVWERELGWYAFGTRRSRFDLDETGIAEFHAAHPGLPEAERRFREQLAEPLAEIFTTNPDYAGSEITVFTEYFGPHSFAGKHKADDPKQLVLFDVEIPEGIIAPEQFLTDFHNCPIARTVYQGRLTGKFIHDVREGKYDVSEGIVCKGLEEGRLWMVKIKTHAYMQRLKDAFADDWETYWE